MGSVANPRIHDYVAASVVTIVAAATLTAGQMGWFSGYFGRVANAAVSGDSVALEIGGVFRLPKTAGSGEALANGTEVGWDAANTKVKAGSYGGRIGRVYKAATDNDTTVLVMIEPGPRVFRTKYTTTSDDNTANSATINTGFGATPTGPVHILIKSAANVYRVPQGAVTWGTGADLGKVSIADSGLAASEEIHISALFA